MSTTLGQLKEFHPDSDSFAAYVERVNIFFTVNDIADDKRAAVFLNFIGARAYELLRSLLTPTLPQTLKYSELVCRLSTHCDFKSYLNEALRDHLVCGLRSESSQRRLLAEKDLSLQKAMEIAQGMEAADRNGKSLKGPAPTIHKVRPLPTAQKHKSPNQTTTEHSRTPCYRCGRSNHDQKDCRFRDATCHNCNKKGHIAPVCLSKKNATGKPTPWRTARANFVGTNALEPDEELESEDCSIGVSHG